MVDLNAYAADCRVFGQVELGDGRMTELLNGVPELHVQAARLESLAGDQVVEVAELDVTYDELCAVVATGSRGDPERRLRTRATRVRLELGPYHIEGAVHGTPAADPVSTALRRAAWVPLTEVTVRYQSGGGSVSEDVSTLIVNRDLATLFQAIEEISVALPWEAARTPVPRPRAFELSGTDRDARDARDDDLEAAIQALAQPTSPEARA